MNKAVKYILFFLVGAVIAFGCIYIYRTRNKINRLYNYPKYMALTTNDLIEDNMIYVELTASYKDFNINAYQNNQQSNNNTITSYTEYENSTTTKDNGVINYLKGKLSNIESNKGSSNFKENAKTIFTETVDFLFYGGTIKGTTFKELTTKGKLEAIKLALKIESKIDEHFPNLIDNLSEKYRSAKAKIVTFYETFTNEYCMENPDSCQYAKEDYDSMRESLKVSFDIVKGAGSIISSKTSDWYQENFK